MPSPVRKIVRLTSDFLLIIAAFFTAIFLRLGDVNFESPWLIEAAGLLLLVSLVAVPASGLHRNTLRYSSLHDFLLILRTITLIVVFHTLVLFLVSRLDSLPRSVPLLTWFVGIVYLSGPRVFFRLLKDNWAENKFSKAKQKPREDIALYGSVDVAELFLRGLRQKKDVPYKVISIFTNNREDFGTRIQGVNVIGSVADFEIFQQKRIDSGHLPVSKIVLTSRDVGINTVRELVKLGSKLGFSVERIPDMGRFESGDKVLNPYTDLQRSN